MFSPVDVLIVGGGVVGLTTALELSTRGVQVAVLDRDDLGRQASWAGAGIIPPGNQAVADTPYEQFRAFSVGLFPELSRRLLESTGIDNGFRVCGALEFLLPGEDTDEWRAPGVRTMRLDGAGLRHREPGLSARCQDGYWIPDASQVRNPWHMRALIAACTSAGVHLHPFLPAEALLVLRGERVEGVATPQGPYPAGCVLIASGAWSGALLENVGCRLPVRPVRGQIALLKTRKQGPRPILLEGHRYIVPRGDGRFLIGSSEENAGFDPRTTAEVISGLLQFGASLLPELASASVECCWAGLRPGSIDGLPYLGPVPEVANLYVAAGHYRSGILLSPATARLMASVLTDRTPELSLEPFRLNRHSTRGQEQ